MEEEVSAPVILTTNETHIIKSPSDVAIIPKNNNNSNNTKKDKTPPSSPSPSSSPSASFLPSPQSQTRSNPLLKRSLTKTFSSPVPGKDSNNTNDGERKLEKKSSIFEILSPFNTKAKRERQLKKSASSPHLEVPSRNKKDCSITVKGNRNT